MIIKKPSHIFAWAVTELLESNGDKSNPPTMAHQNFLNLGFDLVCRRFARPRNKCHVSIQCFFKISDVDNPKPSIVIYHNHQRSRQNTFYNLFHLIRIEFVHANVTPRGNNFFCAYRFFDIFTEQFGNTAVGVITKCLNVKHFNSFHRITFHSRYYTHYVQKARNDVI